MSFGRDPQQAHYLPDLPAGGIEFIEILPLFAELLWSSWADDIIHFCSMTEIATEKRP